MFAGNTFQLSSKYNSFNIVKEELCQMTQWFRANKLSLNIKNTKYTIFIKTKCKIIYH